MEIFFSFFLFPIFHSPSAREILRKQKELEKYSSYCTLHRAITCTYLSLKHTHTSITVQCHYSRREICVMFIWKMAYNFQSNYNYAMTLRQICSGVIFVHIVLISCNFVGTSRMANTISNL